MENKGIIDLKSIGLMFYVANSLLVAYSNEIIVLLLLTATVFRRRFKTLRIKY